MFSWKNAELVKPFNDNDDDDDDDENDDNNDDNDDDDDVSHTVPVLLNAKQVTPLWWVSFKMDTV